MERWAEEEWETMVEGGDDEKRIGNDDKNAED